MYKTLLHLATDPATDGLSGLSNKPVALPGFTDLVNTLFSKAAHLGLAASILLLIVMLIIQLLVRTDYAGSNAEELAQILLKFFRVAFGATLVLTIFTLLTGGF